MLNQIVLVGRIKELNEKKVYIAIPRSYKNINGEYDTDIVPIRIDGLVGNTVREYCVIGDLIGVKGRVEQLTDSKRIVLRAEKITFLANKGGE